jgi:hypothetical protein
LITSSSVRPWRAIEFSTSFWRAWINSILSTLKAVGLGVGDGVDAGIGVSTKEDEQPQRRRIPMIGKRIPIERLPFTH